MKKGFLSALFDFSFSEFVSTRLVRLLFLLGLVGVGISSVLAGIALMDFNRLFGLVAMPVIFLAEAIVLRVGVEAMIVLFRIADHARVIAENTKSATAGESVEF